MVENNFNSHAVSGHAQRNGLRSRFAKAITQYAAFIGVGVLTTLATMWRFSRPANDSLFKDVLIELAYIALLAPAFLAVRRLLQIVLRWEPLVALLSAVNHVSDLMVEDTRRR